MPQVAVEEAVNMTGGQLLDLVACGGSVVPFRIKAVYADVEGLHRQIRNLAAELESVRALNAQLAGENVRMALMNQKLIYEKM